MPGREALLTPLREEATVALSRTLFRKQVLPRGSINYKGRTLTFDQQYLSDLARAFRADAFDQVAFLLADKDNAHTMDPERYRGEVKGMELTKDGLDVLLDLTPEAAELVRKNPKLGVSARIIEDLDRADGKKFPHAIQHVLGTLDPRVTGMSPWQEVSLSEEVGDTLDMTTEEVQYVSTTSTGTGAPPTPPTSGTPAPPNPPAPPTGTSRNPTPVIDLEDLDDEDYEDIDDEELDRVAASLSRTPGSGGTVDLLRTATDEVNNQRINELEVQLAQQRYTNEAREYIDRGVPPVLVQLAGQILSLPRAPVIDLSNGDSLDVGAWCRDLLEQTVGFVELAKEAGHTFSPRDQADERADQVLRDWGGGL